MDGAAGERAPALEIRALVLDFDGVVIDSETTHLAVWRETFRAHGCDFSLDEWATCLGTQGGFDPVRALPQRSRIPVAEGTVAAVHRRTRELVRARGLMPGVLGWLDAADAAGVPTGIASSSRAEWVVPWLEELGVIDRFGAVACYDGTAPPKPAPDLYLAACRALGADPRAAIAVEDSPNGIAAAVAAGLFCVAVTGATPDRSAADQADLVLTGLEAMPLGEVLAIATAGWPRRGGLSSR